MIWEYAVRQGSEARFEELYGPQGDWVKLFRGRRGYLDTELLADLQTSGRYLTIDRWTTQEAYEAFRLGAEEEYQRLNALGEELTLEERLVGAFRS
ncbi:MAG: antibiotic biosynthesis monooxygenase [Candidatus Velamenicoccus archaeovorus]